MARPEGLDSPPTRLTVRRPNRIISPAWPKFFSVEPESVAPQNDTRKPDYAHINWWLLKFGSREGHKR